MFQTFNTIVAEHLLCARLIRGWGYPGNRIGKKLVLFLMKFTSSTNNLDKLGNYKLKML